MNEPFSSSEGSANTSICVYVPGPVQRPCDRLSAAVERNIGNHCRVLQLISALVSIGRIKNPVAVEIFVGVNDAIFIEVAFSDVAEMEGVNGARFVEVDASSLVAEI